MNYKACHTATPVCQAERRNAEGVSPGGLCTPRHSRSCWKVKILPQVLSQQEQYSGCNADILLSCSTPQGCWMLCKNLQWQSLDCSKYYRIGMPNVSLSKLQFCFWLHEKQESMTNHTDSIHNTWNFREHCLSAWINQSSLDSHTVGKGWGAITLFKGTPVRETCNCFKHKTASVSGHAEPAEEFK